MAAISQVTTIVASNVGEWDRLTALLEGFAAPPEIQIDVEVDEGMLTATITASIPEYVIPES